MRGSSPDVFRIVCSKYRVEKNQTYIESGTGMYSHAGQLIVPQKETQEQEPPRQQVINVPQQGFRVVVGNHPKTAECRKVAGCSGVDGRSQEVLKAVCRLRPDSSSLVFEKPKMFTHPGRGNTRRTAPCEGRFK